MFDLRIESVAQLNLAGQSFFLKFEPADDFLGERVSWTTYASLAAGLLFSIVLMALLLSITGRTSEAEALVLAKTNDLVALNESLEGKNIQIIDLFHRLEAFLKIAPAGIFEANSDGDLTYVNDEWKRITGQGEVIK